MCFWIAGTFSGGTSTPRSPRATMIPLAASRIESRCSIACGFSSLAMIHASDCRASSRRRTWRTSSAVRTNETAIASTPAPTANSRSSSSFFVSDGTFTGIPGRLIPLFSPSKPPLTISQTTSAPAIRTTRSSISPSDSRMRDLRSRLSASVLKVVPTTAAVPSTSRGVIVSSLPASSCTGSWSFSLPVRIFGPCRSARMQIGLCNSTETARTMRISSPLPSCVPWEKFSRATSAPARTSSRKTSAVQHDGPSVATILARRVWSSPASKPLRPVIVRDPSIRFAVSISSISGSFYWPIGPVVAD